MTAKIRRNQSHRAERRSPNGSSIPARTHETTKARRTEADRAIRGGHILGTRRADVRGLSNRVLQGSLPVVLQTLSGQLAEMKRLAKGIERATTARALAASSEARRRARADGNETFDSGVVLVLEALLKIGRGSIPSRDRFREIAEDSDISRGLRRALTLAFEHLSRRADPECTHRDDWALPISSDEARRHLESFARGHSAVKQALMQVGRSTQPVYRDAGGYLSNRDPLERLRKSPVPANRYAQVVWAEQAWELGARKKDAVRVLRAIINERGPHAGGALIDDLFEMLMRTRIAPLAPALHAFARKYEGTAHGETRSACSESGTAAERRSSAHSGTDRDPEPTPLR
jgi:hypothetical protein